MNRLVLLVSLGLLSGIMFSYAQDMSGVKAQLDAMFSGLDKTKVPTGLLWDVSVNLVEPEDHNGLFLTDSNYVSIARLQDMISSINSASVWADTINTEAAIRRIQRSSNSNSVKVGVLFKPYNRIASNALQNNLIDYNNGVVSDRYENGIWKNPYIEEILFGFAIGNEGVVFPISEIVLQNVDSLSTIGITNIQIDVDDGLGYRSITPGTSINVDYTSSGIGYKEVKLKGVYNGNTYISHSLILVKDFSPNQAPSIASSLIDTLTVHAEYNGEYYKAKVSRMKTATLDNPIIVSEGFDPWRLNKDDITEYKHSYSGFTNLNDFVGGSYFDVNNIVYVDWYDCGADIRANAKLLEEVINWVNENKTSGNANVVLGQSMGGLIARYCLCDMERRGVPHDTRMFISHDAPHLGANISPGLMVAYWDLYKILQPTSPILTLFDSMKEIVPELMRMGHYTSVKQMLPLYITESGDENHALFTAFQQELQQIGFPHGDSGKHLENIAIVNGGKTPEGNESLYNNSTKLINAEIFASTSVLGEILLFISSALAATEYSALWIPGKTTLSFIYYVYPYLSPRSSVRYTKLVFEKKFLWLIPLRINVSEKNAFFYPSMCYDSYSSSYYSFGESEILDLHNNNGETLTLVDIDADVDFVPRLAFIPTASAFCSGDYGRDFYNNPPQPFTQTPFESFIVQDTLSNHISFWNISSWLDDVNASISVPPIVFSGDTLSVDGATRSFTWASSSDAIATIGTTGIIGNTTSGIAKFTASYTSAGEVITKSRDALVGYPQVALSIEDINTSRVIVKTTPINASQQSYITDAVDQGIISFKWGIKYNTGDPIIWRVSQNDTLHIVLPSSLNEQITVYMKWTRGGLDEPTSREIQFLGPDHYRSNIELIQLGTGNSITYVESFPTTSITSTYGHTCLVFKGNLIPYANAPDIASITINGETFSVAPVLPQQLMRPKQFVSDILYSSVFQSLFLPQPPPKPRPMVRELNVVLNGTDGPIQVMRILVSDRLKPLLNEN